MIVIMTLILLSCGDCCGGGNYATAKGGSLAMRPSTLCTFFCATVQEVHEAFDTRIHRGTIPTDTFISFTSRYPEITFQTNQVPKTPGLLIVKFDTWTAFRLGAMAYKTGKDQWMLTTGIPLESIVLIRDHVGSCLDPLTLDTLSWKYLLPAAEEPVTLIDVETGICKMPTMERWHCLLTKAERENSPELHLFDWRPYSKGSGDPYLSLRHTEDNPTDVALTLSEWNGMKIWQIATIPPSLRDATGPGKWLYSQSGMNYLTDSMVREVDRSRTPARDERGRGGSKGKGSGRKGKKPVRLLVPQKVRMLKELEGGISQVQQISRKHGEKGNLRNLLCQDLLMRIQEGQQQGPNGIPIFKRTWLVSDAPVRAARVLENKAGDPRLWDPTNTEFWSVCHQATPIQGDTPSYHTLSPDPDTRCRLCPSARANELVPCCWCESWVHWRCSYTTKSGRACASHFHVTNPLDKVIVTRSDDETVPIEHRGIQVMPNTFYSRVVKGSLKPSDVMIGLETYWAFKHAWRGAGYYYRKGDHQPLTKGGTSYYANALSIVASWETWYLPRPQPIHPVLIESPDAWELDAHYPGGFEKPTFPSKTIPVSMATREANLVGHLSPEKGNMWSLIYETSHKAIQSYWKYAHHYAIQHSHTNKEYYSWDKFNDDISLDVAVEDWPPPKNFDSRFYYYSRDVNVTEELSTEEGRKTTEEAEIAKTASYTMNEFPSLEMKLISEDSELERGRKLEGPVQPPSQQRRQGTARVSSVPPGSSTALARERAATMNPKQPTGKGASQGKGWGSVATAKLPSDFNPMSSIACFGDTPIEERKNKIYHQKVYSSAWSTGPLKVSLRI